MTNQLTNIAEMMTKVEWTEERSNEFNTILSCFDMMSSTLTTKEAKMAALDHMESQLWNISDTEAYKQSVAETIFDLM